MREARPLVTILFTDLVDSTSRAAELGDHAWKSLLGAHDELVRKSLGDFGGREVNTTGDGFVATFERPDHAIGAAVTVRDRVEDLDLEIRVGLHMGQVESEEAGIGGIAVHLAARVAAWAGPGEVLVSRAVHDAVEGGGFAFVDLGTRDLKGVPGERRLYRVEAVPDLVSDVSVSAPPWWRWPSPRTGLALAAIALLMALAGVYVAVREEGPASPVALSETAAPGVAVLPFEVRGPGAEVWREGMVDVLSANLDGVGGLRAIDSRTVLARWREGGGEEEPLDQQRMLEIAGRSGASYAVIGGLVVSGDAMRLVAEVHDLAAGRPLGEVRVDGAADSVFGLVDRATIQLLDALFQGERDLPDIDLARVTTTSLEALEAFVEAEAWFRRGDYEQAIAGYGRAVEADSTFALAHFRLSDAYGWLSEFQAAAASAERALEHVDRLNRRDALLVQSWAGDPEALDLLRQATTEYPDDAEAWYQFGDFLFHQGGKLLVPPAEWLLAMERSAELDPMFAPPHEHLIHAALRFEPDSAEVETRVGRFRDLAGGNVRFLGLLPPLAFGDVAARAEAMAVVETLPSFLPFDAVLGFPHPRFYDVKTSVLEIARERTGGQGRFGALTLATHKFDQGRIAEAVEALAHPALAAERPISGPVYAVGLAHAGGLPIPERVLDRYLTMDAARTHEEVLAVGAWAVERGRSADRLAAAQELTRQAEAAITAGDSSGAREIKGSARALEGFAAWKSGRHVDAETALEEARLWTGSPTGRDLANMLVRWWLADLNAERGRKERAAEYLLSLAHGAASFSETAAVFRLARVEEELGRREEALANYEWVLEAWHDADPELGSWVEEARQGMIRLGGLQRD